MTTEADTTMTWNSAKRTKHFPRTGRVVAMVAIVGALGATLTSATASGAASTSATTAPTTPIAAPPPSTPAGSGAAPVSRPTSVHLLRAPVQIDLCASTGSTSNLATGALHGVVLPVWGYAFGTCAPTPTISKPGGPTIGAGAPGNVVTVGDVVTIVLHNNLPETTSLLLQGQAITPDTVGVAPGGTATYVFTAGQPGTFLYEAGLTANGQHQVAMGLYGALIVRPAAAGQAYDSATTAFDSSGVLVLGEIDPALNSRTDANKPLFDMRNFKPKYFTINGIAYSGTDAIAATAGSTVLLRYVNAGIKYHSMGVLGASQTIIAYDGNALDVCSSPGHCSFGQHSVAAETFGPGQTVDALVTVPAGTANGTKWAIYDANLLLNNGTSAGFGGMMTFITVGPDPGPGPDTTGPSTTNLAATPNPASGASSVALTATVSDAATGNGNVTNAEYFIDATGANGAGAAMGGTFGTPTVSVSATITTVALSSLAGGNHTISVHGRDQSGNWGPFNFVTLNLDKTGPSVTGLSLVPNPTNGSVSVGMHATGSDAASGGSTIAAAEYSIDGGAAVAMTVNLSATTASLDATIAAGTVNALVHGTHVVSVRSQDAIGNWGAAATISLVVDKQGPTTSAVLATPNPNNGTMPLNSGTPAVRVTANISEPAAAPVTNIVAGEAFIDTVGANGSGIPLAAIDGSFNSSAEAAYADIPLATIAQLSDGSHTISVHGKDAAGNWGSVATTALIIDKTAPVITTATATLSPAAPAATSTVTLNVSGTDNVSGISRVEWFRGTDPGQGLATAMTIGGTPTSWTATSSPINVSSLPSGVYTFSVRARDNATNWSPVRTVSATVSRGSIRFSTTADTNPPGVAGTADNADVYAWNNASSFTRQIDVTAAPYNLPAAANVDGLAFLTPTSPCVSFTGGVVVPGVAGTTQDEDVVCWNGTSWTMYFDGSARGLVSANFDLDEIAIVGGVLYFSTDNGNTPPGAVVGGDDADVYRWNGASTYTRVVNASGATIGGLASVGLPAGANVDGLAYVDATHFYLSFNTDVAVPGVGTVQDEDIVYYSGGVWSVWFDGTSLGLTNANHDLDAIDV